MEMVKTGIVWYPELKKGSCPGLSLCYELAIGIYNHHNKSSARGLVFAMARNAAEPFQDADEIGKLLKSNKRLEGFLRTEKGSLLEDGYDLVRLQYPDHINPVPVDVWHIQRWNHSLSKRMMVDYRLTCTLLIQPVSQAQSRCSHSSRIGS